MAHDPTIKETFPVHFSVEEEKVKILGGFTNIYTNKARNYMARFTSSVPIACSVPVINAGAHGLYGYTRVSPVTAAGQNILGIAHYNPTRVYDWDEANGWFVYKPGDLVSIITTGDFYGYAEKPVEVGDPVYVRIAADAAGGFNRVYSYSNTAGAGLIVVPDTKFVERCSEPKKVGIGLYTA